MSTNLHIVRKALICIFLFIVLTAELTASGAAAFEKGQAIFIVNIAKCARASTDCPLGGSK
jgi:hypothetical protein